ncbi:unnamed protein product [Spirodela intermedia]|uniref:DYW domain-containing protein n=1 Tax=Spirodela intermedia TaxID=51605 RepID=A0A7I8L2J9_SPIIN|nr:unnamed protein product [Spirodela intermedia]
MAAAAALSSAACLPRRRNLKSTVVPRSPSNSHLSLSVAADAPSSLRLRRSISLRKRNATRELSELLTEGEGEGEKEEDAPLCFRWHGHLRLAVRHGDLELARAVHAAVAKKNPHKPQRGGGGGGEEEEKEEEEEDGESLLLMNSLMSAYVKLGETGDARQLFGEMRHRDVVSYTCLISAYAKSGQAGEALELFLQMQLVGIRPNAYSLVAILTSCIRRPDPLLGSQLHAAAVKLHCSGEGSDLHVGNALMAAYVAVGRVEEAVGVFTGMAERDAVSWSTVISGMVKQGRHRKALQLFREMRRGGLRGDSFTVSGVLTAAAAAAAVEGFAVARAGEGVHAHAVKMGLELELSVGNSLMAFYTRFGSEEDVAGVFRRMPERDVISWNGLVRGFMAFDSVERAAEAFRRSPERNGVSFNTLLAGFRQNGHGRRALNLFREMVEGGLEVSAFTLSGAVAACAMLREPAAGEQIHGFSTKAGCTSSDDHNWIGAALLDMYAKCGRLEAAEKIFRRWEEDDDEEQESRDIAWTAIICGYAGEGRLDEALGLFNLMQRERGLPAMDRVTLTAALRLCGQLGAAAMGRQLHGFLCKSAGFTDRQLCNAVLSMYAKCGDLEAAVEFFRRLPEKDVASWNALIKAHLLRRRGDEAIAVWRSMEAAGVAPDAATFSSVLSACKFTGADSADECRRLLCSIEATPSPEHYAAAVDAMSFWGHLEEAEEVIRSMPMPPDSRVWRALLRHCDHRPRREAALEMLRSGREDPAAYILVSNLYAASGRWRCAEEVRKEMREKGLRKRPARSWLVDDGGGEGSGAAVHWFYARDRSHPRTKDIYAGLELLIAECMKEGYEPDTSFVLQEAEEFQKRDFLFYHSAKLAAAFGHLAAPPGRALRVVKNVRLCGDCHSFLKTFSAATGREVLLRDPTGFHHFRGGSCSCGDRW